MNWGRMLEEFSFPHKPEGNYVRLMPTSYRPLVAGC